MYIYTYMYLHVEKSGCAVIKRCTFYQNAYMTFKLYR